MSKNSVWITTASDKEYSKPVLEYILEQAKELEVQTDYKLKAYLEPTAIPWSSFLKDLAASTRMIQRSSGHKDKQDASDFYKKQTYEFFIVDERHKYEFSLFQITCNDLMPAYVNVDADIAEEESMDNNILIYDLNDFINTFKTIVQSDKVVYIINKLLNLPDPEEKD